MAHGECTRGRCVDLIGRLRILWDENEMDRVPEERATHISTERRVYIRAMVLFGVWVSHGSSTAISNRLTTRQRLSVITVKAVVG